jgi:hypothetical protein
MCAEIAEADGFHCPVEPPDFYVNLVDHLPRIRRGIDAVAQELGSRLHPPITSGKFIRTRDSPSRIAQTKGKHATIDRMSRGSFGSTAGQWSQNHWQSRGL